MDKDDSKAADEPVLKRLKVNEPQALISVNEDAVDFNKAFAIRKADSNEEKSNEDKLSSFKGKKKTILIVVLLWSLWFFFQGAINLVKPDEAEEEEEKVKDNPEFVIEVEKTIRFGIR